MKAKLIIFTLIFSILFAACSSSESTTDTSDEITSPPAPPKVAEDLKTEKELSATASAGKCTNDRWNKVMKRGKIVIGVKADYKPWGYRNTSGELVGMEAHARTGDVRLRKYGYSN